MHILHVSHFGAHRGGVEGYIRDVSEALSEAGHASHLIYLSPLGTDEPLLTDSTYFPFAAQGAINQSALAHLEKAIAEIGADVAILHAIYDASLVEWLRRRLPTIGYVHGPYLACPGYALYLRASKSICPQRADLRCVINAQIEKCCFGRNPLTHLRRLHQVLSLLQAYEEIPIVVGSQFMKDLLHRNRIPLDHIHIVPPILFADAMEPYAPPEEPETVLFAGRVEPEKGLEALLSALAAIKRTWKLVVAGDGSSLQQSKLLAARLGIANRVAFLGWTSQAHLNSLYQRCGFVVLPSLWPEPFGRVGPEALRHGRPVVAFAVGGTPDWLKSGINGYLVPPRDLSELQQAIEMLLADPKEQRRMGRRAKDLAATSWRAVAHVQQIESVLNRAILEYRNRL